MTKPSVYDDVVMITIGTLLTVSIGLSAYIFKNLDTRIALVEAAINIRSERIAVMEQKSLEDTAQDTRIESKLDELHNLLLRHLGEGK